MTPMWTSALQEFFEAFLQKELSEFGSGTYAIYNNVDASLYEAAIPDRRQLRGEAAYRISDDSVAETSQDPLIAVERRVSLAELDLARSFIVFESEEETPAWLVEECQKDSRGQFFCTGRALGNHEQERTEEAWDQSSEIVYRVTTDGTIWGGFRSFFLVGSGPESLLRANVSEYPPSLGWQGNRVFADEFQEHLRALCSMGDSYFEVPGGDKFLPMALPGMKSIAQFYVGEGGWHQSLVKLGSQ